MAQVNSPIIQSDWMVWYKRKQQLHLLFLRLSSGICLAVQWVTVACFACSMVEQLHTFRMSQIRKNMKRRNRQQPHVFERCGGFLTWGYPQIIHFYRMFNLQPSILGSTEICPGQCHLHETSTPNLLASQAFPCPVLVADHAWHTGRFHKCAVQVDQTKQGLNVASKNWV